MNVRQTALERAFDIARSGECESIQVLRAILKGEGHGDSQIEGRTLTHQLRELLTQSRKSKRLEAGQPREITTEACALESTGLQ
jgi:hypothetical protein